MVVRGESRRAVLVGGHAGGSRRLKVDRVRRGGPEAGRGVVRGRGGRAVWEVEAGRVRLGRQAAPQPARSRRRIAAPTDSQPFHGTATLRVLPRRQTALPPHRRSRTRTPRHRLQTPPQLLILDRTSLGRTFRVLLLLSEDRVVGEKAVEAAEEGREGGMGVIRVFGEQSRQCQWWWRRRHRWNEDRRSVGLRKSEVIGTRWMGCGDGRASSACAHSQAACRPGREWLTCKKMTGRRSERFRMSERADCPAGRGR